MAKGLKRTISHAAIYGIGNALQSAAGFLMLPIYTRYLTPADYGTVSMMQILLDFTSIVVGMQIATAVFRHYYKETDKRAQDEVLGTAMSVSIGTKLVGAVLLSACSGPASLLVFGQGGLEHYVAVFAFSLVTDSLAFIPQQYLRILERPVAYVSVSLIKLCIQIALNLWFIVHLEMGVQGVIYSNLISGALVGGTLTLWMTTRVGLHFRWARATAMVAYTWPLIGAGMLAVAMNSANRLALVHFHGLAEVGVLALAAQFSAVLRSLIWQPFNQVWGPQRFKIIGQSDANATFTQGFRMISMLLITVGTTIGVLSSDVLRIMSSAPFLRASHVVPLLVLAELTRSMTMFANTPLLVADRTIELLRANIVSAIALVAALVLLVPFFGMVGAAVATVASGLAAMWWVTHKAKAQQDLGLPWLHYWVAIATGAGTIVLAQFAPTDPLWSIASKLVLLAACFGILLFSPLVGPGLRATGLATLRSVADRLRGKQRHA